MACECPGFRLLRIDAHEVEGLFPRAVCGTRLETNLLHSYRKVVTCHDVAPSAGAAPFVTVVAYLLDDPAHERVSDFEGRLLCDGITARDLDGDR